MPDYPLLNDLISFMTREELDEMHRHIERIKAASAQVRDTAQTWFLVEAELSGFIAMVKARVDDRAF